MADKFTVQQRHRCMASIRSKDTKPEIKVRHELWHRGFRYRMNVRRMPGSPDIVLAKYRSVIFVNGCFWHGHEHCKAYVVPKTNVSFWQEKVRRNRERDELVKLLLESSGWNVMIVWECELKKETFSATMSRVEEEIKGNALKWKAYMERRAENRKFTREEKKRREDLHRIVLRELRDNLLGRG